MARLADFTATRKVAEKDLFPKGFKVVNDDPKGFGRNWRSVEYARGTDMGLLFQHLRYKRPQPGTSPHAVVGHEIEGWVSFQLHLKRTIPSPPQKDLGPLNETKIGK